MSTIDCPTIQVHQWSELQLVANQAFEFDSSLYTLNETTCEHDNPWGLATGESLEFRIWKVSGTVLLTVGEVATDPGGSQLTITERGVTGTTACAYTVSITAADMDFAPGQGYKGEIVLVKASPSTDRKRVIWGPIEILGSST